MRQAQIAENHQNVLVQRDAFVNGIMEGVDWVWNNGILEQSVIEDMETEIKNAPKAYSSAVQIREFKNFLSLIKSNM